MVLRVFGVLAASLLALLLVTATAVAAPAFNARGSVEQVYVTGATPGAQLTLVNGAGKRLATRPGQLARRASCSATCRRAAATACVPPPAGRRPARSRCSRRTRRRRAPASTTSRSRKDGYGYLTTRDGTKLAINVHPPQDVADALPLPEGIELPPVPTGPTPTLIEYSGYGYANPAGPQSGIAVLANLMGFAVVDVNMRGTGCSGGAFDFFEPLQSLDGYDVIETIARRPWVLHGKVGMMGISYGGISQLFTAATNPPSLAAISPLSVIDATQTTLYPGGILNTGFAVAWAKERLHEAKPASADGRSAVGLQADPGGRPDLQGQPGASPRGGGPDGEDPRQRPLRPRGRGPARAGHVRQQDQRADVHGLPVAGRADGRSLPDPGQAVHRHRPEVVHVHQRHARRLARAGDLQPLVRLPAALRRETGADPQLGADPRRRADHLPGGDGDRTA